VGYRRTSITETPTGGWALALATALGVTCALAGTFGLAANQVALYADLADGQAALPGATSWIYAAATPFLRFPVLYAAPAAVILLVIGLAPPRLRYGAAVGAMLPLLTGGDTQLVGE
jgi:hypothetical protein